ncbi:MAG: acetylglutamate kinase [bacterium]
MSSVIKLGGSIAENLSALEKTIRGIKGIINDKPFVLVHGGGKQITNFLSELGIETYFIEGERYTDRKTMEVVEMVLSGLVNKQITSLLCHMGINALGISGRDLGLIVAKRKTELGFVGEVKRINVSPLQKLLDIGFTVVLSPVSETEDGLPCNVNADFVAIEIGKALKTEKLLLFTDVSGIMDSNKNVIPELDIERAKSLIEKGIIKEGMIPKTKSSIEAIISGVKEVWIGNNINQGTVIKRSKDGP